LKKAKKGPAATEDAKSADDSAKKDEDLEKGPRVSGVNNGKLQGDDMNEKKG
jgi:hypothetical protein